MSSLEQFNNKNNFKRYVCSFCGFRTHKKYNLDVHKKNKHPDPNVHPYQNHENQPIPQHWLIAQHPHGYEYGEEVRAPTKVSVGPNHQSPTTKISVGPNEPMPPTTISVPPIREKVQHGDGIKMDDEHGTDEDDEGEGDTDSVINDELDKKRWMMRKFGISLQIFMGNKNIFKI